MKILVLGSSGMLGSSLFKFFQDLKYEVYGVSRSINTYIPSDVFSQIDFTQPSYKRDLSIIKSEIDPELIINASGLTSIEACKNNPDLANFLNGKINEDIIDIFSSSKFIYLSTDSVFDGLKGNYSELDKKNPLNHYAQSKSYGEDLVLDRNTDSIVLRTNIYGRRAFGNGPSIVDWALGVFKNQESLKGYTDYFFNPLHLNQVGYAIKNLISKKIDDKLFHIGSEESVSKFEFLELLKKNFGSSNSIIYKTANELPKDGILRPKNTTLNYNKFKKTFGVNFTLAEGIKKIEKEGS